MHFLIGQRAIAYGCKKKERPSLRDSGVGESTLQGAQQERTESLTSLKRLFGPVRSEERTEGLLISKLQMLHYLFDFIIYKA